MNLTKIQYVIIFSFCINTRGGYLQNLQKVAACILMKCVFQRGPTATADFSFNQPPKFNQRINGGLSLFLG